MRIALICGLCLALCPMTAARAAEPALIGHWPLGRDIHDQSATKLPTKVRGAYSAAAGPREKPEGAGQFNGQDTALEFADHPAIHLGTEEFSLAAWVHTDAKLKDVLGDLISQYDPATRTGFHLGIYNHGGVTNSQSNSRQLHFGIDQGLLEESFTDHGRPGTAMFIFSLCVHDGRLYASTCHAGENEAGHVFRFEGGDRWTDLGSPDKANSVSAMAVYNGALYVASSKYRLAGSALSESENPNFGGKVYKLGADDQWIPCGTLTPETEAVGSLIVFDGKLYAGSLYRPAGFFRYEGGDRWTALPTPDGKRVEAMAVFNGGIYATSYDEASVFRFDGETWEHLGKIPEATQTYGFAVYRGDIYVSEWPLARVFRYAGGTDWIDSGKLGQEMEAMPLLVYNGKMYGGTLPTAEVYRYDGGKDWARIAQVDLTPDVKYRRAWSMAVYQGRLFVGTLPSGRVLSIAAGQNVTWDRELSPGWHHVAAVRGTEKLSLYVDGKPVAEAPVPGKSALNLTNNQPLQIGFGAQDYFHGKLADVRLYRGSLSATAVQKLADK